MWLQSLGAKVAGFSLGIPTHPSHFTALGAAANLERNWFEDIRNGAAVESAIKSFAPQIVFHLAADAIVSSCLREAKGAFDINLGGTVNVLEALRKSGQVEAAVFITSDKCYENVEWEYGYREQDRLGGSDPYSASKACAELAIHSYIRSYFGGADATRIARARAGNVIGGGDWAESRLVPDTVRAWGSGQPVVLRKPRATRPWQHVLEPLSGYLWLAARLLDCSEGVRGEAFNFGPHSASEYSVGELVAEMSKHWPNTEYLADEPRPQEMECTLLKLCCDKAKSRLGWQAVLTFPETARLTVDWYRNYYDDPRCARQLSLRQLERYVTLAATRELSWVDQPGAARTRTGGRS
jgi:CDP-glucose 4,6-dehydratase